MSQIETQIDFCNYDFDKEKLFATINDFYPVGIDAKAEMYAHFKAAFNSSDSDHGIVFRQQGKELEQIRQKYYIPDGAGYLGLDLPTWLNFDNRSSTRRKIMVVGIDPMRTDDNYKNEIVIGTPYGFHEPRIRAKMMQYWTFVSKLAENNSVYLTDTFKVFYYQNSCKSDNLRSYNDRKFTHPQNIPNSPYYGTDVHQDFFKKEYDIVKPDLIVTLGNIPRIWFSAKKRPVTYAYLRKNLSSWKMIGLHYNCTPILPLPHLSGRSNAARDFVGATVKADVPRRYAEVVNCFLEHFCSSN